MDRRLDRPGLIRGGLRRLAALLCLIAAAPLVGAQPEVLRPEAAFRFTAEPAGDAVLLRWTIEPEHYMYRDRMGLESRSPSVRLGEPELSPGIPYEDEWFGKMEIYRDTAQVRVPVLERPDGSFRLELTVLSQGCADIGLCYPPQRWDTSVSMPARLASAAAAPARPGWLAGAGAAPGEPLPPEEAFRPEIEVSDPFNLAIRFAIADGYYMYRHGFNVSSASGSVQPGAVQLPPGEPKWDEEFGDTLVFYESVEMQVPLSRRSPDATAFDFELAWQGCKEDSICYPPMTRSFTVMLPAADLSDPGWAPPGGGAPMQSEQDRLSALISGGSLLAMVALFTGLGLLLAFTPCVLPMVPILARIIVGQGPDVTTRRAFLLSLSFVMGMALTYTLAGAAFAAAGQQVQGVLQQPWVIIAVAALFSVLALSMFGFYELQVPSSWQTRLNSISSRQQSGSYWGAAVMGLISALVVSACVTPPLVAALTVIAQAGDVARGALALFALSIGMGIPLLIVGTSAGRLLPKAGPWMEKVKALFGVMMLAVAVWMLERILPGPVTLALWAVLAVIAGVFLGAFHGLERDAPPARQLGKGLGVVSVVWGVALMVGALAGNDNPWQPLRFAALPGSGLPASAATATQFRMIKTVDDLDRELAAARASGTPVMLDFYADWCISCKEMERFTFTDAEVATTMSQMLLLKADVTRVDADDQALMQRFGIIGPPTIIFFDARGEELRNFRLVGFKSARDFLAHLNAFLAPNRAA
ncbi:MAG: protein-disulfide reductase DsbD [Chromatiales bacterium]|nr:protein-disulfide reductase DsbD [Chromatiales bacterium]